MYLEQFKLTELPFRLSPDPQFLYLSKQHARAKAYMESTVWFTDGFVVITGEIGAGKTTLIESLLREVPGEVVVAQINQTQVSVVDFLQAVLAQFGFSPFRMRKAELISTLNNFLIEQHAAGRKVLLIVDEAQNLSMRVLEEIRMLSGVETTKDKVLRIILAGQPELNAKLDAPELVQLTQRVRLRFHLNTLTPEETRAYIQHRLAVAGAGERVIFAPESYEQIERYCGGVPRLINTLCDTALMAAFAADRDHVTLEDIASAVAELQWPPYAARQVAAPAVPAENAAVLPPPGTAVPPIPVAHAAPGAAVMPVAPQPPWAPLARLLISTDGHAVQEVLLRPGRLIIGRTAENDVQIDSRFVSRHHCQIVSNADSCVVEDLNSTNGIHVKGARVRRHYLNDGDVIAIGKHELTYINERAGRAHAELGDTLPRPIVHGTVASGEAGEGEPADEIDGNLAR